MYSLDMCKYVIKHGTIILLLESKYTYNVHVGYVYIPGDTSHSEV